MKIHFIGTIWGDSTLLESRGKFALVDVGDYYHYHLIKNHLDALGVTRLEFILITHFHRDHYGCLRALVDEYEVDTVYYKQFSGVTATDGDGNDATDEYRSGELENCRTLREYCETKARVVPTEGLGSVDFDGIDIRVFYGDNTVRRVFEDEENECFGKYICNENQNSLMLYFAVNGRRVVMGGDITDFEFPHPAISMMNTRAAREIGGRIDVYKAPHHGYGIGSDEALAIYRPLYTYVTNRRETVVAKTDVVTKLTALEPEAKVFFAGEGGVVVNIAEDSSITWENIPQGS